MHRGNSRRLNTCAPKPAARLFAADLDVLER
jgi:hypothetical protein